MRWLFLFVLSLNLAYIAWQMNQPSTEANAQLNAMKKVQPIYLLSEIEAQKRVELQAELEKKESDQTVTEQLGSVEVDSQQNIPEKTTTSPVDGSIVAEQTTDVQAKAISVAGSENNANADAADTALADQLLNSPTLTENDRCYTLGPFTDLDVLRALTGEIKPYVVTIDFRGREVNEHSLYWVYIKPEKDRKSAIATGRRLKSKKIKDYYVIREGEKVNGVSLGYFRNKGGAYGLVEKVKKLGFDVVLEPVYKTYTVYWLDYQVHDETNVLQSIFDRYLEAAKTDKITKIVRDCAA